MVVSDKSLCGHALKLQKPEPLTDMLKYNYFCCVVEEWNTVPKYVAEAVSLSVFKQKLSNLLHCIVNYNCLLLFLCVWN